jgi:hypothetical protein
MEVQTPRILHEYSVTTVLKHSCSSQPPSRYLASTSQPTTPSWNHFPKYLPTLRFPPPPPPNHLLHAAHDQDWVGRGYGRRPGICIGTNVRRSIVQVRFLKLQKISVPLGETPLLFLPFGPLIQRLEVSPEDEDHDDAQPVCRNTNTVRIYVSLAPRLGPDV